MGKKSNLILTCFLIIAGCTGDKPVIFFEFPVQFPKKNENFLFFLSKGLTHKKKSVRVPHSGVGECPENSVNLILKRSKAIKKFAEFARCLTIAFLCASMVSPNIVLAYGGRCTIRVANGYTVDTSSACISGICVGDIKVYPYVYNCDFQEHYPSTWKCDNKEKQYKIKITPMKTVENESWGRWLYCMGANAACGACIAAAAVAAAGTAGEVACYYVCGALDALDVCCTVDCEPNTEGKYEADYRKGCQ